MSRNGEMRAVQDERERDRDQQYHSQNVSAGQIQSENRDRVRWLDQLTKTDLSALQPRSQELLANLLTADWVLGNYSSAETWELKMELKIMWKIFLAAHPDQECSWTGPARAYLLDDADEALEPLTDQERMVALQALIGAQSRLTRGEGGFQQEQAVKTINVSEIQKDEDESGGSGLFGRWRS